jgi:PST family polysaccharide transporter
VDSQETPAPEKLSRSATRGALWNSIAYWASRLALLPTTVVLARLLSPEEFGLVALGLLVVTYLDVLRQFGISSALIQWPEDNDRVASAAFWLSLVSGTLIAAGAMVLAPMIAGFFRQPDLTSILRVLSLAFVVDSVSGVYEARIRKRLQFQRRVGPELGRALVKGVTAIVLAILGFGVWSLVLAQVASSSVAAALYWWVGRWTPSFQFDWSIARSLCRYGAQYAMFALLAVVVKDVDYLIIGRRMSAEALGYYTLAFRLPELTILGICYVFSQTLFPVFSRLQAERLRLAGAFAKTVRLLLLVTLPLGVGMALVAPELVRVVFSEKWVPAIPAMRWLALYASVIAVGFVAGDVYKAVGRTGLLNVLALGKLGITAPVIWLAGSHGIEAVALAQFGVASVVVAVEVVVVLRILDVASATLVAHVLPVVGSGMIMAASVLLGRELLSGGSPAVRLAVFVGIGASTYAAAIWFLARSTLLDVLRNGGKGAIREVSA